MNFGCKDSANEGRNKTCFGYAECNLFSHLYAKIVQTGEEKQINLVLSQLLLVLTGQKMAQANGE